MKVVLFAGGVGTRLWPLSRKKSPKQFEKIEGDHSMLQLAINRLTPEFDPKDIFITTGRQYKDIVEQQLPQIPKENIFLEPVMRDVGPAVALTASIFAKISPDEPFAMLWGSDHLVKEEEIFRKVLKVAGQVISEKKTKIVFIGQKPRFANQNVGWIRYGSKLFEIEDINFYEFKHWKYRPELEVAKQWFKEGHHAWNLGYYVSTPRFVWDSFRQFAPNIYNTLLPVQEAWGTKDYEKVLNEVYPTVEKISFDDAVLEKIDLNLAYVISQDVGWSDVGAWEALKEAYETVPLENITRGKVFTKDTTDTLVFNYEDKKLVVSIDMDSCIVVNTPDVLLITKKTSVPKIKKVVESFQGTEHEDLT